MTLEVDTDALRGFNTSLQAWSTDTAKARSYAAQHLDLGSAETGVFANLLYVNRQVVTAMNEALDRIRTVARESGLELTAAAKTYDETDREAAQRHDAQHKALTLKGNGYADVESRRAKDGTLEDTTPVPPEPDPEPVIDVSEQYRLWREFLRKVF